MTVSYPVGQAPWEKDSKTVSFPVGQAPWEQPAPPPQKSLSDQIWGGLVNGAKNVATTVGNTLGVPASATDYAVNAVSNAPSTISTNFSSGVNNAVQGAKDVIHPSANTSRPEAALSAVSGAATAATSPVSPFFQPVSDALGQASQIASDNPTFQKAATALPDLPYNRAGSVAGDVGNIAGTAAGAKGAFDTVRNLKPTPDVAADTAARQQQKIVSDLSSEWKRPAEVMKPSFNKARGVLSKDPETPQFLAEQGIDPKAHIEDSKYNTEDTASNLRDTAGKLSRDAIRPSLQFADYQTPKTDAPEITKGAISALKKDPNITPDDVEHISASIENKIAALERKYPNGMTLTDMHDEKITFAKNGGYRPLSMTDNNAAIANRAVSSALDQTIQAKVPAQVPYKDFNTYLTKYYRAADFLDSLHTKTAPATLGQNIARGVAKFGGAAVGAHLGGGIVSEFAGYQIGKAIEHAMENLPNPARNAFIHNIEITNPEAFTKVQEFLKSMTSGNTGTPRLNAPSAIQLPPAELGTTKSYQSDSPIQASQPKATPPAKINKTNSIPKSTKK